MSDLERIVPLAPDGTAPPLFCVHASSGSAYSYFGLAQLLGPDQPVYGIEAPGFDDEREPVRSLPALSAEYAQILREFRPEGDVVLLGWSLGGIIAFDLAHRLSAAGVRVRQVIMVDVSVPTVAQLPPEKEIVRRFLLDLLSSLGAPLPALEHLLAAQPDEADSDEIFAAAERSGTLPEELDADLLGGRYAVFRAHVEASYGFEVTEPYSGSVVHLIASESPREFMHWNAVASNSVEHIVAGNHHSIWTNERLPRLADLTRAALNSAD